MLIMCVHFLASLFRQIHCSSRSLSGSTKVFVRTLWQMSIKQSLNNPCLFYYKHSCRCRISSRVSLLSLTRVDLSIKYLAVQTRQERVGSGKKAPRSSSVIRCSISEVDGDQQCRIEIVRDKKQAARIKPRDPKFHLSKRRNCLNPHRHHPPCYRPS